MPSPGFSRSSAADRQNRASGLGYHFVCRRSLEMCGSPEVPGSVTDSYHNQIGFKFHGGFENSLRGISEPHGSLGTAPQLCLLGNQLVD